MSHHMRNSPLPAVGRARTARRRLRRPWMMQRDTACVCQGGNQEENMPRTLLH